jgi:hypothetical protein
MWPALEAMAPSMVYDAVITTVLAVPTKEMTAIGTPTLIINGAGTWPQLRSAAESLAGATPAARHTEVPGGENHHIPPEPTAALLKSFLLP